MSSAKFAIVPCRPPRRIIKNPTITPGNDNGKVSKEIRSRRPRNSVRAKKIPTPPPTIKVSNVTKTDSNNVFNKLIRYLLLVSTTKYISQPFSAGSANNLAMGNNQNAQKKVTTGATHTSSTRFTPTSLLRTLGSLTRT